MRIHLLVLHCYGFWHATDAGPRIDSIRGPLELALADNNGRIRQSPGGGGDYRQAQRSSNPEQPPPRSYRPDPPPMLSQFSQRGQLNLPEYNRGQLDDYRPEGLPGRGERVAQQFSLPRSDEFKRAQEHRSRQPEYTENPRLEGLRDPELAKVLFDRLAVGQPLCPAGFSECMPKKVDYVEFGIVVYPTGWEAGTGSNAAICYRGGVCPKNYTALRITRQRRLPAPRYAMEAGQAFCPTGFVACQQDGKLPANLPKPICPPFEDMFEEVRARMCPKNFLICRKEQCLPGEAVVLEATGLHQPLPEAEALSKIPAGQPTCYQHLACVSGVDECPPSFRIYPSKEECEIGGAFCHTGRICPLGSLDCAYTTVINTQYLPRENDIGVCPNGYIPCFNGKQCPPRYILGPFSYSVARGEAACYQEYCPNHLASCQVGALKGRRAQFSTKILRAAPSPLDPQEVEGTLVRYFIPQPMKRRSKSSRPVPPSAPKPMTEPPPEPEPEEVEEPKEDLPVEEPPESTEEPEEEKESLMPKKESVSLPKPPTRETVMDIHESIESGASLPFMELTDPNDVGNGWCWQLMYPKDTSWNSGWLVPYNKCLAARQQDPRIISTGPTTRCTGRAEGGIEIHIVPHSDLPVRLVYVACVKRDLLLTDATEVCWKIEREHPRADNYTVMSRVRDEEELKDCLQATMAFYDGIHLSPQHEGVPHSFRKCSPAQYKRIRFKHNRMRTANIASVKSTDVACDPPKVHVNYRCSEIAQRCMEGSHFAKKGGRRSRSLSQRRSRKSS